MPSSANMAAEELKSLLKNHRFTSSGKNVGPSRSGSAPPSMEGSNLAIGNLYQHNSTINECSENVNSTIEWRQSEEQLCADPAHMAYYVSNINMSPSLSASHVSGDSRRLVRHNRSPCRNWGLTSVDDSGDASHHLSQRSLPTHKEEPEEDQSPPKPSNDWVDGSTGELRSVQDSTLPAEDRVSNLSVSEVSLAFKISIFSISSLHFSFCCI